MDQQVEEAHSSSVGLRGLSPDAVNSYNHALSILNNVNGGGKIIDHS
jgi:hypothetical protein